MASASRRDRGKQGDANARRIEIVIDELVLVGFDPRDRHRIADALQRAIAANLDADSVRALAQAEGVSDLRARDVSSARGESGDAVSSIAAAAGRSIAVALNGDASGRGAPR